MMKIYFSHSRGFDFQSEFYVPIRNSEINKNHQITLPHENSDKPYSSKEFFQNDCDLLFAEVSHPSIGLGIEVAWANGYGTPVYILYRKGMKVSNSVKMLADKVFVYENFNVFLDEINLYLQNI